MLYQLPTDARPGAAAATYETLKTHTFDVLIGMDRTLGAKLFNAPAYSIGRTAVVLHTLEPGALAAPPHRHSREDEYSFVLEGELTVWEEGVVRTFGPGELAEKRRHRLHTFWNAGPAPLTFLEIITPGDFAYLFEEIDPLLPKQGQLPTEEQVRAMTDLSDRYGLYMDFASIPDIMETYGLVR